MRIISKIFLMAGAAIISSCGPSTSVSELANSSQTSENSLTPVQPTYDDERVKTLLKVYRETRPGAPFAGESEEAKTKKFLDNMHNHQLAKEGLDAIDPLIVQLEDQRSKSDAEDARKREIDALVLNASHEAEPSRP